MRLFRAIFFAAAVMAGSGARAELVNGTQFQSGNWKGAAYTNDTTNRFSHCAMSTAYQSGISMFFAISADYTWRVGWSSTSWNLNVGQNYGVSLVVDGVNAGTLQARAVNKQFALAELPAQANLFNLFRQGNLLTMYSGGQTYQFSLLGTNAALTVLGNCTRAQLAGATPQTQPVPQPAYQPQPQPTVRPGPITAPEPQTPQPAAQPAPQPPPPAPPPATNPRRLWPESTAQQRVEASRILYAILALPAMRGFRPMGEREALDLNMTQPARADLTWRSDLLVGALDIVPTQSGLSADAIANTIIAADRRACGGRFESATAADQRSQRVVRLHSSCEASLRTTEARYMVVPTADGASHYVFAVVGPSADVVGAAEDLRAAVFEVVRQ